LPSALQIIQIGGERAASEKSKKSMKNGSARVCLQFGCSYVLP